MLLRAYRCSDEEAALPAYADIRKEGVSFGELQCALGVYVIAVPVAIGSKAYQDRCHVAQPQEVVKGRKNASVRVANEEMGKIKPEICMTCRFCPYRSRAVLK
jgi:hypothetical protein